MNTTLIKTVLAAAVATGWSLAQAAGSVDVNWLQPEQYSDAGRSVIDREQTLQALALHLQTLARRLPDGQTLHLEVLDLDLAGALEPWGWHELRVLRGRADWPRMTVRYALLAGGQTLKAGEAQLAYMNYMDGVRDGALAHEKRMLDRWFKATFVAPQCSPAC